MYSFFNAFRATCLAAVLTVTFLLSCKASDADRKWGEAVEGQQLSIKTDKSAYPPGERIILSIVYKNSGDQPIMTTGGTERHYDIKVIGEDGRDVPLTRYGQGGGLGRIFNRSVIQITPGEEQETKYPLSRMHDLTMNSKYTITVKRKVWRDDESGSKWITVTSNKLQITIDSRLDPDFGNLGW
jgi:hypothetical protein